MTPPPSEFAAAASNGDPVVGERPRPAPAILPTDGERLMRFARRRDEAAFRELVDAHAALVWGVCWQVLRHEQDAEDAFQATFLILARRARAIREAHSVAGWLYRVAFRTALLARARRARRAEEPMIDEPASADDQLAAVHRREQCLLLLEELHALPAKYRGPLALCYLEGRSRREAADELGVTAASVKGLLARGTRMLRSRLVRRGVALSGAMAAASVQTVAAQAAMNPALVGQTAALGIGFALGGAAAAHTLDSVANGAAHAPTMLAEKGLQAMSFVTIAKPTAGLIAMCAASVLALAAADGPTVEADNGSGAALTASVAAAAVAGEVEAAIDASPAATTVEVQPATPAATTEVGSLAQTAAPAREEAPRAGVAPTTDVFVSQNSGLPTPAMAPVTGAIVAALDPTAPATTGWVNVSERSSRASLQLEVEYWTLKGRGLEKKAAVLRKKADMTNVDRESGIEALELLAESELMLAEVKLCEANAQRLKDALAAPEERPTPSAAQPTLSTGSTYAPAAWPTSPSVPYATQNSGARPANAPTGLPPATTYATPPPVLHFQSEDLDSAASTQIDALVEKLESLQKANERMERKIEELENAHNDVQ